MDDYALLPCPFCGGMPLVLVLRSEHDDVVRVECIDCKCSTPSIVYRPDYARETIHNRLSLTPVPDLRTARQAAVAAWNTRTTRRQDD